MKKGKTKKFGLYLNTVKDWGLFQGQGHIPSKKVKNLNEQSIKDMCQQIFFLDLILILCYY